MTNCHVVFPLDSCELPVGRFGTPIREHVKKFIRELTSAEHWWYDLEIGGQVIHEVWERQMDTRQALSFIREELRTTPAGCCFNYGGALAYLMSQKGFKCAIVTSVEGDALKVSVAYPDIDGELIVCDIVEYIKGAASIDECYAIPFEEFKRSVGGEAWLIDVERAWEDNYFQALISKKSNVTPEELVRELKEEE